MAIPDINQEYYIKISDANLIIINFPLIFFHRIIVLKYSYLLCRLRSLVGQSVFQNTSLSNSNCHKEAYESNFYRYIWILRKLLPLDVRVCILFVCAYKSFRPIKPSTFFLKYHFCCCYYNFKQVILHMHCSLLGILMNKPV